VTDFDMSDDELLDYWRRTALKYAAQLLSARDSGDEVWETGMAVTLRQALANVRRCERAIQIGGIHA
jgi:hypothetical protein